MSDEHRDEELGRALRELPVPGYEPTFHAELHARLETQPPCGDPDAPASAPDRRRGRARPRIALWRPLAAGLTLALAVLLAVVLTRGDRAPAPSPAPTCGAFCQGSGGLGGVGDPLPAPVQLGAQAEMRDGIASFHVSCRARARCVGALVLYPTPGAEFPSGTPLSQVHRLLHDPINRVDLSTAAGRTEAVRVPLSGGARVSSTAAAGSASTPMCSSPPPSPSARSAAT